MISIIITTCKRPMDILKRALDSAMKQTVEDKEIILVNDYPPYRTDIARLLEGYDGVKFISHEKNAGACKARNNGIRAASGEYVAFLDDDDEWADGKLARQLAKMQSEDAGMVYCTGVRIYPDGKTGDMAFIKGRDGDLCAHLLAGNFMGGCSFPLIKKSVLTELRGFDESLPSSQDYDLWIRIASRCKVVFLDEPLVLYHVEQNSISSSLDRRMKGYAMLLAKHGELFDRHPAQKRAFIYNMARTALLYGRWDAYLDVLAKSLRCFPGNLSIALLGAKTLVRNAAKRLIKR